MPNATLFDGQDATERVGGADRGPLTEGVVDEDADETIAVLAREDGWYELHTTEAVDLTSATGGGLSSKGF